MEKIFYLAQVLGTLNTALCIAFGLLLFIFVGLIISCIVTCQDHDEYLKDRLDRTHNTEYFNETCKEYFVTLQSCKKWAKRVGVLVLISFLAITFIPNKKTYLFMKGGEVIDTAIENNPEISELSNNTLHLLNEYIKSQTYKIENKVEKKK